MIENNGESAVIHEWISQQFYRHGLFCATYPKLVICFTILSILWACSPLISRPIYSGNVHVFSNDSKISEGWLESNGGKLMEETEPIAYVLQVVMKAMVHPYNQQNLLRTDAFRGPLATSFKLHLQDVSYFQIGNLSLDTECLKANGLFPSYKSFEEILPEYGCLCFSPANLWRRDPYNFQLDPNWISSVFHYQRPSKEGQSSLSDLMFGMRSRDTGISQYSVRNRQRTITYAVTIILKQNNPLFVQGLRDHLFNLYPLHRSFQEKLGKSTHMFFSSRLYYIEVIPFIITLIAIFVYVSFSCSKIDFIHSKYGIGIVAVMTVLGSNAMALSLSSLSLHLHSKVYLIPYLLAFISLENILVITRSIAGTPAHLDVKIRIARGLSIEGWNITKSLLMEITILSLGFIIGFFESSIQEFCVLALMGLLSDFYLQIFFFLTVLSMDMVIYDNFPDSHRSGCRHQFPSLGKNFRKSSEFYEGEIHCELSKRVRLWNFWARRRIIQRLFSFCMIVWIITFIYYQTGLIGSSISNNRDDIVVQIPNQTSFIQIKNSFLHNSTVSIPSNLSAIIYKSEVNGPNIIKQLLHSVDPWTKLPHTHWPMLFGLYNVSLFGKYISILPPIKLSMIISPESAIQLRHPNEEKESFSIGRDDTEADDEEDNNNVNKTEELSYGINDDEDFTSEWKSILPTSKGELFLALIFLCPSFLFLLYLLIVFYKIICSRHYAEWRSSWFKSPQSKCMGDNYNQVIQESLPMTLSGHAMEIDSFCTDGNKITSLCLEGTLFVWDSISGDKLLSLNRKSYFNSKTKDTEFSQKASFPDLSNTIYTNFTGMNKEKEFNVSKFEKIVTEFESFREFSQVTNSIPSVWDLHSKDDLIALGCSNGQIELWNAVSGSLQEVLEDRSGIGITNIRIVGNQIVLGRLSGSLEFYSLFNNSTSNGCHGRRGQFRSLCDDNTKNIQLTVIRRIQAHQQPLTSMETDGKIVVTGSQDHTLKVFCLLNHKSIFTLIRHCGPITTLFIDQFSPGLGGSGSQDGILCLWDLNSGACIYSIQAHQYSILSITYSLSYVISLGSDNKLCVWERFQGILINTIHLSRQDEVYSSNMIMLTHNVVLLGRHGALVLWNVLYSDPIRIISLDTDITHAIVSVKHCGSNTIVCDYGHQLILIHFPMLFDKLD